MTQILRAPVGQPTGGQFAAQNRSEGDIALEAVPDRSYGNNEIVGYTFKADNYRGDDLIEELIKAKLASPAARDMAVEDVLDQIAGANAIDREDEYTFDTDDFPKVIFGSQVDISDAPWLGDEHWSFPDYENEPLTAQDALDQFSESLELSDEDRDGLWEGTDYRESAERNLAVVAENAGIWGIDLDALGYSLPVKTAARA